MASKDWIRIALEGGDLDEDAVAELEREIASAPEDLELRVKRLGYLSRMNLPRGAEVLWLVRNHPDVNLSGFGLVRREDEPDLFDAINHAWDDHLGRGPDHPALLRNAAQFARGDAPSRAKALLQRGALLEPNKARWPADLGHLLARRAECAADEASRRADAATAINYFQAAYALETSTLGRHLLTSDIAEAAIVGGDFELARQSATTVLDEVETVAGTWQHGNALHNGHIVLGHVALAASDTSSAELHLLEAGRTPGSPQLDSFGPDLELARALLGRGRSAAVLQYLTDCTKFWECGRPQLRRWISDLEAGRVPTLDKHDPDDDEVESEPRSG